MERKPGQLDLDASREAVGASVPDGARCAASICAADLVRVFSSASSVAGERFCVSGRVRATRGLSYTDGRVLGIRHPRRLALRDPRHIGAFQSPMSLTVLTTTVDQTRRLQAAWKQQTDVTLVIRFGTTHDVPGDTEHVLVTILAGGDVRRTQREDDAQSLQNSAGLTRGRPAPVAGGSDSRGAHRLMTAITQHRSSHMLPNAHP